MVGEAAARSRKNAASVIIAPGFGMAVTQARQRLRERLDGLKAEGGVGPRRHPPRGRQNAGQMDLRSVDAATQPRERGMTISTCRFSSGRTECL